MDIFTVKALGVGRRVDGLCFGMYDASFKVQG